MNEREHGSQSSGPVFFERNRVFRVYTGGKLFGAFFGEEAADGNFPEEWVASSVRALNREPRGEREGVSRVRGTGEYFDLLLDRMREPMLGGRRSLDMLVKILDSAIRLPVQAHPDKVFSRRHFGSEFGKTEAWIVLDTRENAKIHFGFRDGVTREDFVSAFEKSAGDRSVMASLLNELPARKGDVYLIHPGTVHAIGAGCLILEVQEPTDFTVQPEAWCGDHRLDEYEMFLGLERDQAFDCFDFSASGEAALRRGMVKPRVLESTGSIRSEELIGYTDTPCFSVIRRRLRAGRIALRSAPCVVIVTEGSGVLRTEGGDRPVRKGDYFFIPHAARGLCGLETAGELEAVECIPPASAG